MHIIEAMSNTSTKKQKRTKVIQQDTNIGELMTFNTVSVECNIMEQNYGK